MHGGTLYLQCSFIPRPTSTFFSQPRAGNEAIGTVHNNAALPNPLPCLEGSACMGIRLVASEQVR